jgi:hypothetical protein
MKFRVGEVILEAEDGHGLIETLGKIFGEKTTLKVSVDAEQPAKPKDKKEVKHRQKKAQAEPVNPQQPLKV